MEPHKNYYQYNTPKLEGNSTEIQKAKKWTDKPFGVNIMLMSPFVKEVMQVVVDERVAVVTTGAGNPAEYLPALNQYNTPKLEGNSTKRNHH